MCGGCPLRHALFAANGLEAQNRRHIQGKLYHLKLHRCFNTLMDFQTTVFLFLNSQSERVFGEFQTEIKSNLSHTAAPPIFKSIRKQRMIVIMIRRIQQEITETRGSFDKNDELHTSG